MQTYAKYSPTGFDSPGAFLEDRQEWLVVPVGRNRDSGSSVNSNWAAAIEMLGGESDDVEVHSFGHWACGWFEIILVRPGSAAHETAKKIEKRLEDYPYLDEDDVSSREHEEFLSDWSCYGAHDFRRFAKKMYEFTEDEEDLLDEADDDKLREFYMDRAAFPYEPDGEGICIRVEGNLKRFKDKDFEDLITLVSGGSLKENPAQAVLNFQAAE